MSEQVSSSQSAPFSFVEAEHQVLKFWEENEIFEKSLQNTKSGAPYIFYDGPPFATGLPHHGHLVGSTLKDIVPRYFTMKGKYVSRRFGWDCHGLPIEHEIDKKLGMSANEAVEKLGVAKYNNECRSIVQRFSKEWEKTIRRIGRWVDFENDYKTMDLPFMESVWWVFKSLWDKGLIYQGTKVVPFSTALGTVLSNFEATSNYQDVQDPAVTVLFKIEGKEEYLAAWTTTPWTLPSNLGLCVGPDIDYVKVKEKESGKIIILAEARLEAYSKKREFEQLDSFNGEKLKGLTYEPLFPFFADLKKEGAFQVFTDGYVSTEDGTGIVHTAPAFGEDDNRIVKEAGFEFSACPVDDEGKFTEEVSPYQGTHVKEADKQIIKDLKEAGKLFEQSVLVHSYPFCPRSDTPLIYKAIPSWYVRVEKIKKEVIASNKQINWVPDHIQEGRFGKWLEGAKDWAISRNRVWGTPLPIWINEETGNMICMGSLADLEKYTGKRLTDLHREHVDPIEFSVQGEIGTYKRIPEVLDCWFESGSMPYAQLHYPFENEQMFKEGFPAEYIAEGLDQTRGWFYTLNILSTALYGKPAFKNVIVNGLVLAEDGKKMSKRLKNYTPPDVLMENFGADALRLFLINSGLVKGEELRFSDNGVKDMVRRVLLPWYNSYKFFQTYAEVDKWSPIENFQEGTNILDQWINSKLQTLITNVTREMDGYRLYNVVPELFQFIEDLTNWYIRLNRRRFWEDGLTDDKCQAYSTLYTTVKCISTLMAPFAPFLSEHVYQELKKFGGLKEYSVHLCDFPQVDEKKKNSILEDAVSRMQQIILLGRQKRNQVQIKVKTPLRKLTIIHKDSELLAEVGKLSGYIKNELNIKEIDFSQDESQFIRLYAKPNLPVLGKRLGKEMGRYRKHIENLSSEQIASLEAQDKVKIDDRDFTSEEILVFREAIEGTNALSNRLISINVDCELDQDLISEGLAREVVNRIQKTRKDMNLNVADRIVISFTADSNLEQAIEQFQTYICKETLCNELNKVSQVGQQGTTFKIENYNLSLEIGLSQN